jgi:hypothetical protein
MGNVGGWHEQGSFFVVCYRVGFVNHCGAFGAENALSVFQWRKTPKGTRYVPVAIIADNPKASHIWKALNRGAPAEKNYRLVERDTLQIQVHGTTFFAGWTMPIPLMPGQEPIPPSVLIVEGTGKVKVRAFSHENPIGIKSVAEYNCFNAFITFIHQQVKYKGPATDGLFTRDYYQEVHLNRP